jgi:arginase
MGAMNLTLLGVPSSSGARNTGTEKAPGAIRHAGLVHSLQATGHDVRDAGDQPESPYVPDDDPSHRKLKNLQGVIDVVRTLAGRVEAVLREGRTPLILGGDCTVALGSLAGAVSVLGEMGLAYLDRDAELNTPRSTPSGILDGMVIAHLLGRGEPSLATPDGRAPLLRPGKLALLGVERFDRQEIPFYEALPALRIPGPRIWEMGGAKAAAEVLTRLAAGEDRFWVHCDLDVLDGEAMPAVDFPAPGGMSLIQMEVLLARLTASAGFTGLEVTNFNPDKDPGGEAARRVVAMLCAAFSPEGPRG